jgi:hypothetical protein
MDYSKALYKWFRSKDPIDRYNVTGSKEYNFLWFRVAKTGTRSMLSVLEEETRLDYNQDWAKPTDEEMEERFCFTFVRNPWDRLVSTYFDKVGKKSMYRPCWGKSFEYFVDFVDDLDLQTADRHIRLQSTLFPRHRMDFIGYFEQLRADAEKIFATIGIDRSLPHRNATKKQHYSAYYNTRTAAVVRRKYSQDIEAFGYDFQQEIS